jgi:hypothetical protein
MTAATKPTEPDNLALWNAVCKTDPAHTKRVNQRGGFTAIDAQYQFMEATRQFGPLGVGWGYVAGDPIFAQSMVVVPVTLWHGTRENSFGPIYGCAEMFGKHPDRDAPKKAETDAITKGLSQLGFNADVFLGRFDDNKYVEQVRAEFAANDANGKGEENPLREPEARAVLEGPHKSKTALRNAINGIIARVREAETTEDLDMLLRAERTTIAQATRYWPVLINGHPDIDEDVGLRGSVALKREELSDGSFKALIDSMKESTTLASFTNWVATNERFIDELSDAERRRFERERDAFEAGLMAVAKVNAG